MLDSVKPAFHLVKLLLAFMLSMTCVISTASAAPVPLTQTDADAWLDGMMPSLLQGHDIAGAVVVIVKDGKILTQRGFGYADTETRIRVDPANTLFRPGSISKLFTWTAVMQLVEQGKIDLDADINTYLDFRVVGRGGKKITMRHLMTHRGGFEETNKDLFTYDPKRNVINEQRVKAFVPKMIFDPGAVPAYSNYGTAVAGYIVQRLSKMPFDDYVERHIFAPLGMAQSSFRQPLPKSLESQMSKGYLAGSDPALPFEYISIAPAGSLSTTGGDMARFMIAHLQNGQYGNAQLFKPDTAMMMHNSATQSAPGLNNMFLGFYEASRNGHRIIAHAGATDLFFSNLNLYLDDGVGLFISFNSAGNADVASSPTDTLFGGFADRYFPETRQPLVVDKQNAIKDANFVAGNYANSRRSESSFGAALNIFLTFPIKALGDGSLIMNIGKGDQHYAHVGAMLWANATDGQYLSPKIVNGVISHIGLNPSAPIVVGTPVPYWRSGAMTIPAILLALFVYAVTALSWPFNAIIRYAYKIPAAPKDSRRLNYTGVRIAAWSTLAVLMVWAYILDTAGATEAAVSDSFLMALQVISAVIGIGSILLAIWRVKQSFASDQRWLTKIKAIAFLGASLFIAWAAWMGGLYAMTTNY